MVCVILKHEQLKAFAEPIVFRLLKTQAGKSAVISEHELNVGGVGETGCLSANLLAKEADLVIGIVRDIRILLLHLNGFSKTLMLPI